MTTNLTALRARLESWCIGNSSQFLNESVYGVNCTESNLSLTDQRRSELAPFVHWLIGGIMVAVFVLGLCENMTVIFVYVKTPKLRTVNSVFVIGLSLSDLGQTLLNIPFVIVASFSRRWIFGHAGCMYIGCVTTWFGITQISLLCVIAIERYFIIVYKKRRCCDTIKRAYFAILFCFIYGLCFAIAPVLGWSEYKLVSGEISCSLNWSDSSQSNLAYIFTLFILVWFLPLSFVIFGYIRITMVVCADRERRRTMKLSGRSRRNSRERKVAITVLLMVGAFVVSWTPYSIVALMSAFGDMSDAPASAYLVPAAFAKASIIWNPIIYISRHRTFKQACRAAFKCGYANDNINDSENDVTNAHHPRCRNRSEFHKQGLEGINKAKPLLRHQSTFWSTDYGSYFQDSIKETTRTTTTKDNAGAILGRNKLKYISVESTQLEITEQDTSEIKFQSCDCVPLQSNKESTEFSEFLDENVYLSSVQKLSILQKRKVSIHQIDCSNTVSVESALVKSDQRNDEYSYKHNQSGYNIDIRENKMKGKSDRKLRREIKNEPREFKDITKTKEDLEHNAFDFNEKLRREYICAGKRKEYRNKSTYKCDKLKDHSNELPEKLKHKPSFMDFKPDQIITNSSKRKLQHKQIAKVLSADNDSRHRSSIHRSRAQRYHYQQYMSNSDKSRSEAVGMSLLDSPSQSSVENTKEQYSHRFFIDDVKDVHGCVIRQSTV